MYSFLIVPQERLADIRGAHSPRSLGIPLGTCRRCAYTVVVTEAPLWGRATVDMNEQFYPQIIPGRGHRALSKITMVTKSNCLKMTENRNHAQMLCR